MILGALGEVSGGGLELFDGLPIGEYSFRAIVVGLVLALFSGKVVTKRQLDDCREDLKLARATNETQAAELTEIKSAVRDSVEIGRTTVHILREIQTNGQRHREERQR